MSERLVKDFNGKLIPRDKARKIGDAFYEEGVSCIKMPDNQWYRISTDKIRYDWEKKVWKFTAECGELTKGLVDDGSLGYFTPTNENVPILFKKDTFVKQYKFSLFSDDTVEERNIPSRGWTKSMARTEEIAIKYGYIEMIADGKFYKDSELEAKERVELNRPNVPQGQRTNTYSIEDDGTRRRILEAAYHAANFPISREIAALARYIPYTFGLEFESSNGFIPERLRNKMGVTPLRDGSISGIEYVTVPLEGAKGIQNIKNLTAELTKRCALNLQCSVHVHFGNVRRDKLYTLALWQLCFKLQNELLKYFPYSRTNSIRSDGKVYCKALPDLNLSTASLLKIKSKEEFTKSVLTEFNKIYSFLNNQHGVGEVIEKKKVKESSVKVLAGKQTPCYRLIEKTYCYSTRNKQHSIRGHKWDRPQRYYFVNFLPTFFSNAETIEFRCHEATLNFDKTIMWMLTCAAILKFAENTKVCLSEAPITLQTVLSNHLPDKVVNHLMAYYTARKATFVNVNGTFKSSWESIETNWINTDKNYLFNNTLIETV